MEDLKVIYNSTRSPQYNERGNIRIGIPKIIYLIIKGLGVLGIAHLCHNDLGIKKILFSNKKEDMEN